MIIMGSNEEWLHNRTRIGGSDAASIIGKNPWKTNIQLWEEKCKISLPEDISDKPYIKYGHEAEKHLRALFALDHPEYSVCYEENNLWLNSDLPFAHASLDGWLVDQDGRKGILEIKTTNILQSMQKEKWDHRIPDNYYCQVIHYLMVTGWDFAVLKAQLKFSFPGETMLQTKHYKIERSDVEADIEYMKKAEMQFWEQIQRKEKPALILPMI